MSPSRRAFTLIEVLIAILIIGASMVPIFFMFSRSSSGTLQSRDEVIAYGYAGEILEYAQARGFDDPLLTEGENKPVTGLSLKLLSGSDVPLPADPRFPRSLHVRVPDFSAPWPTQYKVLVASVSFQTGDQLRTVFMTGLVSKVK